ncbi:hypothetical protein DL89DRAFT_268403, partial [Linderina pennispora]
MAKNTSGQQGGQLYKGHKRGSRNTSSVTDRRMYQYRGAKCKEWLAITTGSSILVDLKTSLAHSHPLPDGADLVTNIISKFERRYRSHTPRAGIPNVLEGKGLHKEDSVEAGFALLLQSIVEELDKSVPGARTLGYLVTSNKEIDGKGKPDISIVPTGWCENEHVRWHDMASFVELKGARIPATDTKSHGQLSTYLLRMWESYWRIHCVGMMVIEGKLWAFSNTRGGICKAEVGKLPFIKYSDDTAKRSKGIGHCVLSMDQAGEISRPSNVDACKDTVRFLFTIFTLPISHFGWLFPCERSCVSPFTFVKPIVVAPVEPLWMIQPSAISDLFGAAATSSSLESITITPLIGRSELLGCCQRPVGTISWGCKAISNATGSETPCFLKVLWGKSRLLRESYIYEQLALAGVPHMPKVHWHGQFAHIGGVNANIGSMCGEAYLMEDCGDTIDEFVANIKAHSADEWRLVNVATGYLHTLFAASAGEPSTIHRDISSGNFLVCNRKQCADDEPFVIDWEFALLLCDGRRVNDVGVVAITGTRVYMGWCILSGTEWRSLVDDIESMFLTLFHVIYKVFPNTSRSKSEMDAIWGNSVDDKELLHKREDWFQTEKSCMAYISERCHTSWRKLLRLVMFVECEGIL